MYRFYEKDEKQLYILDGRLLGYLQRKKKKPGVGQYSFLIDLYKYLNGKMHYFCWDLCFSGKYLSGSLLF